MATSTAIVECYNLMRYDAIGITSHDLQMGSSFLEQLARKAVFPFLSANLVRPGSTTLLFPAHTIITRDNIKIGIIGITDNRKLTPNKQYAVLDWHKTLEKSIKELQQVDLLIVLSNLPRTTNLEMAKTYKDVNIILEGGQQLSNPQTLLVHNSLISHTPKEGKYIGQLQIDWQKSKIWETEERSSLQLQNDIDRLQWFKNRIAKRGGPEKAYKNSPAALTEFNKKMAYLETLETKLANTPKENMQQKGSTYNATLHPLKPSIHDEPQTAKILKTSRKTTNTLRRKTNVYKQFDVYMGSTSCKPCHGTIYKEYKRTRHSRAYGTLVDKSDNNNPSCIFCHVTGLPERLAYIQAKIPKRLLEVGCETCHGPGQQHIKHPKSYKLKRTVPESTCLTCHTEDHSNDFNYDQDVNFVH